MGKCHFTLLLLAIACTMTVSAARSAGRSQRGLLTRTLTGAPIDAGLQDATLPVNGTIPVGHLLSGQGLWASTLYSSPSQLGGIKAAGPGVWGQAMYYSGASSAPDVGEVNGANAGISISSTKFAQQKFVWTLDSANGLVYQIGSADGINGNGVVAGVFLSQPSAVVAVSPPELAITTTKNVAVAISTAASAAALAIQVASTAAALSVKTAAAGAVTAAAITAGSATSSTAENAYNVASYIVFREARAAAMTARTALVAANTLKGTVAAIASVAAANVNSAAAGAVASPSSPAQGRVGAPNVIAIDSAGDAWVGNGLTNAGQTGTLVKIVSSNACDTTLSGASAKTWAAGSNPTDCRITKFVTLPTSDVRITSLAIDGQDNLWIMATHNDPVAQATSYLNVYRVSYNAGTSTTAQLVHGLITIPGGLFGAPGGYSSVIDKWNNLWIGNGAFMYDGATNSVLRIDTNNAKNPLRLFATTHPTKALNLDADSNLWIAGDHTVTKLFTDPAGISDGAAVAATPADPVLMLSTSANAPIDIHLDSTFISYHITNPAYAFSYWSPISDDDLWDTGIVISRGAQNNIYVANSGVIGKVALISNGTGPGTPYLNQIIFTGGGRIRGIAADQNSTVWVTNQDSTVHTISDVDGSINPVQGVSYVSGLANPYTFGAVGDSSGYVTAPVSTSATFTYLHDTAVKGFNSWDGGSIGWNVLNASSPSTGRRLTASTGSYAVFSAVGDDKTALLAQSSSSMQALSTPDAILSSFGPGQYLRIDTVMTRASKSGVENGPQAQGRSPTTTQLRMSAAAAAPSPPPPSPSPPAAGLPPPMTPPPVLPQAQATSSAPPQPMGSWSSVTSNGDGTKLVASEYGGYIYTSSDAGRNWAPKLNDTGRNWMAMASSSNGVMLLAAESGGYLFTSSDSGSTWTTRLGDKARSWKAVAASGDGLKLSAVISNDYLYTSSDSGVNWTPRINAQKRSWAAIAVSSNGAMLVAAANFDYIYTSSDSGKTWTPRLSDQRRGWIAVASSSDGTMLVAAARHGSLYTSLDSGATWTARLSDKGRIWKSLAISSDGTALSAAELGGFIYTSNDSGKTWVPRVNDQRRAWYGLATSNDSITVVGAELGGFIYASTDSGKTFVAVL